MYVCVLWSHTMLRIKAADCMKGHFNSILWLLLCLRNIIIIIESLCNKKGIIILCEVYLSITLKFIACFVRFIFLFKAFEQVMYVEMILLFFGQLFCYKRNLVLFVKFRFFVI